MTQRFHEFVYLDTDLVESFLSQEEDGVLRVTDEVVAVTRDGKFEGKAGIGGTGIGLGKGTSTQQSTSDKWEQTPESTFLRFVEVLQETEPGADVPQDIEKVRSS